MAISSRHSSFTLKSVCFLLLGCYTISAVDPAPPSSYHSASETELSTISSFPQAFGNFLYPVKSDRSKHSKTWSNSSPKNVPITNENSHSIQENSINLKDDVSFEDSGEFLDNVDYKLVSDGHNEIFEQDFRKSPTSSNDVGLVGENSLPSEIFQPITNLNQIFWPRLPEQPKSGSVAFPDEVNVNLDQPDVEAVQYSSIVRILTNRSRHSQHSSVHVSSTNLNDLVDFILQYVRNEIKAKGEDEIKIPDIHETFKKKIGFIKAKGSFDGNDGWFKQLSTIRRTGDVTVSRTGLSLDVVCALGLETMEFGFRHYVAKIVHIRVSGHMDGHVGKNSVSLKVNVGIVGGQCKISLVELKLVEFGDIKVKVSGLGAMSWLLSDISTWAAKHFRDKIVSRIEQSLSQAVTETLSRAHCSQSLLDHLQNYYNANPNELENYHNNVTNNEHENDVNNEIPTE